MENLRDVLKLADDPLGRGVELDRELVGRITASIDAIVGEGEGRSYLSLFNPLVQGKDAGEAVLFAAASLQARAGDEIVARQLLSHLMERLEQHGRWEALAPVLEVGLDQVGSPEMARIAARIWEKGGGRYATASLLEKAHSFGERDHRVLWALGVSRIEEGNGEGYGLVAASLPGFARHREIGRVEEGVLHILEKPEPDSLALCLEAFDLLIHSGDDEAVTALFDLTQGAVAEAGLAGKSWEILRRALEKSKERESYRKIAAAAGVAAFADLRQPEELFATTGLADGETPVEEALAVLETLLRMPPGRHVLHQGWGVGEIVDNDGKNLRIRFASKGIHRMSVSLARTALRLLEPTDLRTKVFVDRDGMMKVLEEEKGEFLLHVLEHLEGEATQDKVKKLLVGLGLLDASRWSEWWKAARKEAEKDGRFDMSQIFRKVIRLRRGHEKASSLPEVDLSSGLRKNFDLLFKFLDQHPEETEHFASRYGGELEAIGRDGGRVPTGRVQAHLLLRRIGKGKDDEFHETLRSFVEHPEINIFTTEQQRTLLAMAPEDLAIPIASILLDSHVQGVRREAWTVLAARAGRERGRVIDRILAGSPARANAVLHVVRELTADEEADVWPSIHALITLVEHPEKDAHRKQALAMLGSDRLRRRMTGGASSPEDEGYLRNRLLNWKHSERYLFPILEALAGTSLAHVADEVEAKRRSLRPQPEEGLAGRYPGRIFVSRATLKRIRKEAEELSWELKTTIPQEIRKAREHGDLRENAEYDAAKEKQASATRRLDELYERIRLAKVIEEIEVPDGEAGPGTEVTLRSDDGEARTYWILGEGDRDLGENVISYRAPLGSLLLDKKTGDEIGPVEEKTYRIVSIRRRMPGEA